MSSSDGSLEPTLQRLKEVRNAFLQLHKALLDTEQEAYEQAHGRIQSRGELFQLVIGHEWFDWLRPMSQFIAYVDERFAAKDEPVTSGEASELLGQAKKLVYLTGDQPLEETRYYQDLQHNPDVAFMHVKVARLLADT
jgi:hypothetical protein